MGGILWRDVQKRENRSGVAVIILNADLLHGINPYLKNVPGVMLLSFSRRGIKPGRSYFSVIRKNVAIRSLKSRQKKQTWQGLLEADNHRNWRCL